MHRLLFFLGSHGALGGEGGRHCGCFEPGDWPDVAVSMLLEGDEDPEIAELAGPSRQVSG